MNILKYTYFLVIIQHLLSALIHINPGYQQDMSCCYCFILQTRSSNKRSGTEIGSVASSVPFVRNICVVQGLAINASSTPTERNMLFRVWGERKILLLTPLRTDSVLEYCSSGA